MPDPPGDPCTPVRCGTSTYRGVFYPNPPKVVFSTAEGEYPQAYAGKEVSPNLFQRLSGLSQGKNWKKSILAVADRSDPFACDVTLEMWLKAQGLLSPPEPKKTGTKRPAEIDLMQELRESRDQGLEAFKQGEDLNRRAEAFVDGVLRLPEYAPHASVRGPLVLMVRNVLISELLVRPSI